MSAMGSVSDINSFPTYQLALTTPGISPLKANSLKQIRHSWNLLMKPRGLPQILHLLWRLTLNFGGLCDFIMSACFAIFS